MQRSPLSLAFGGLLALAAAMGIGRFVYTPILPFMSAGLDLPAEEAGSIAAANFLGYLCGALLGASPHFATRPRLWFLGGLFVSALTSAAMAGFQTALPFMAIRFISGLASAFVLVFSTTLILERLARAGAAALSALHFAGVGCGIALSAILVAQTARLSPNWQDLWLVSGAATAMLFAAVFFLVPQEKTAATHKQVATSGSARKLFKDAAFARLVAAYGLFGFGYVITATFVSAMARSTAHLAVIEPYVWLVVGICAAPSILIWNKIAQRIGTRPAFALACLVEALGVAMTAFNPSAPTFLTGAGLLGATFMGITALGLMEARKLSSLNNPASVSQALALMTASFGLGQVFGPWFAGRLHAVTGSFEAPSLIAATALVGAAALAFR